MSGIERGLRVIGAGLFYGVAAAVIVPLGVGLALGHAAISVALARRG